MNIFTPLVILILGGPPAVLMWLIKKTTGRSIAESTAHGLIFLAVILIVPVGIELTGGLAGSDDPSNYCQSPC